MGHRLLQDQPVRDRQLLPARGRGRPHRDRHDAPRLGRRRSSPARPSTGCRSPASCSPTPTATTSARSTRCTKRCRDAEVIISARDARLLKKDMSLDPGEPDRQAAAAATRAPRPSRRGRLRRATGWARWRRSPRPGHTPGHLAFLDTRDGTLFCGDAYSTLGGVATCAKANWRFPLPAMATWHRPTALETREGAAGARTRSGWPPATARWSRTPAPRWTRRSPRRASGPASAGDGRHRSGVAAHLGPLSDPGPNSTTNALPAAPRPASPSRRPAASG